MRLIAGKYRGKRLLLPPPVVTRPTSDRARESVFNILMHDPAVALQGARVMDIFAGSGAMGLEALSRGAHHVTFVENNPLVLVILRQNIQSIQGEGQTTVHEGDGTVLPLLKIPGEKMDLVFLDPPYGKGLEKPALLNLYHQGYFSAQTLIVLETSSDLSPDVLKEDLSGYFKIEKTRIYGAAQFFFLRVQKESFRRITP